MSITGSAFAQKGFPDGLRKYSDNGTVPFRIGTAVGLNGGDSRYPVNGYGPGLLTHSARDVAYQALIRGQFNEIEPGNDLKMMSLWTGGAHRVSGHYVADTNLFSKSGPLAEACAWAEANGPKTVVRGHVMVYNQDYTLPRFLPDEPPLFLKGAGNTMALSASYKPGDLRDMLESYVRQVVDATMAQNATSRASHGYKVVPAWDVTNEVVSEDLKDTFWPQLGFAYRANDPWYADGPGGANGVAGYDYVDDIYSWATQEMAKDVGTVIDGRRVTTADRFELYYNDYNLEWNASKVAHVLNMIAHIRKGPAEVDGVGFQAHLSTTGFGAADFSKNVMAVLADGLRFSVTENDVSVQETPKTGQPSVAQQEANQGTAFGAVVGVCRKYNSACDAFQLWGATDDGSWLQNQEATPLTRWVLDTRAGPTHGQFGYWPKEGQPDPETLCDPATGALDPGSGHVVSDGYDQILRALKAHGENSFPR